MNLAQFQILLQKAIDSSSNTLDYLFLSRAVQTLAVGQVREVATYANLPSAASNEGLLVFVTADERIYWSTGTGWYNLIDENKGIAYAWGGGFRGKLGDNTEVNKSSPVSVIGSFTDWCQVSAGGSHSIGLRSNGTVWAWGCSAYGRLGDNCTVLPSSSGRSSPVSVVGGFTDWCYVSAGDDHNLGVRTNGTAWGWGNPCHGVLGNNFNGSINVIDGTGGFSSPVSVVGGFTDWCQVSAGNAHSLGVRRNGTAWAWGCGSYGLLGDGTTVCKSSPVLVVGGFTDWCQVDAGGGRNLGVRQNGTAWGWGCGSNGRLGDGTTVNKSSPVSVVGGFTDWCQVSAGSAHSLGVRQNGTAWAWGAAFCGKLGDGTTVNKSSPVSVVGGFFDWCQVSAGANHSLGVRQNGTAWAWGIAACGVLGSGAPANASSPVSVVGGFTDWCQVSASNYHSLALRRTNFV